MLRRINIGVIIVSLVSIVITLLLRLVFEFNILNVIFGMVIGMLLTILRMWLLSSSINKVVEMEVKDAKNATMLNYLGRYILTALILIVAILYSMEVFIGAVVILVISTKLSIYMINFSDVKKEKQGTKDKQENQDNKENQEKNDVDKLGNEEDK